MAHEEALTQMPGAKAWLSSLGMKHHEPLSLHLWVTLRGLGAQLRAAPKQRGLLGEQFPNLEQGMHLCINLCAFFRLSKVSCEFGETQARGDSGTWFVRSGKWATLLQLATYF